MTDRNTINTIPNDRILAKLRIENLVESMLQRIMNYQDPTIDILELNNQPSINNSTLINRNHDSLMMSNNTSNITTLPSRNIITPSSTVVINTLLTRDHQGTFTGAKDLASLLRVMQSSHQMVCI